jgi:uncharacterized surface anchored protein
VSSGAGDPDRTVDNLIGVTLQPGEQDTDNNFVDSNNGAITGTVKDDNGRPIPNVPIQLQNSAGIVVATTTTDSTGAYKFTEVEPGTYKVVETNLPAYPKNVSDNDSTPDDDPADLNKFTDNAVGVELKPGETDTGNDFVDSDNGKITGTVKDDALAPLGGVLLTLKDSNDDVVSTTLTNGNGVYVFDDLEPGVYTVVETNPPAYPANVLDQDQTPDDVLDSNTVVDNVIGVTLAPGETDDGNNFVDGDNGAITGSVKDDDAKPLSGATITLSNAAGTVIATTVTNSTGLYEFTDLEPGKYTVTETNPPGYKTDVSDGDTSLDDPSDGDLTPDNIIPVTLLPSETDSDNDFVDSNKGSISGYDNSDDGDAGDKDTLVDNTIAVTLKPSEDDKDNNFVDSDRGSISGSVRDDKGTALVNVDIVLKKPDGTIVASAKTNPSGQYTFNDVDPGNYIVEETNPPGYPKNVSDGDEEGDLDPEDLDLTPDNSIKVTLKEGETDAGNNFVDSNNGSISGTVTDDQGEPLGGVEIQLQKPGGSVVATTLTGSNGAYTFPEVEPDTYVLVEKNPPGYPGDVSDYDTKPDGDAGEDVVNADNKIPVILKPGEDDVGNNFVDSNNGLISGTVKDDKGDPLPDVTITLLKPDGSVVKTTATDTNGFYVFSEVEPGTYDIKETNLPAYPLDVSDYDGSDDTDPSDSDRSVDNLIGVTLKPGEKDTDNNFVDSNNGAITGTVTDDNGSFRLVAVLSSRPRRRTRTAPTVSLMWSPVIMLWSRATFLHTLATFPITIPPLIRTHRMPTQR